jgi:hypothetical protein
MTTLRILETRIMDNISYLTPKAGQTVERMRSKAKSARIDLASSPPTRDQALDVTRALVSNWTGDLSDDRLDSISQIWLHFPLPICKACVDPWSGIAGTKAKNQRTGALELRRFVPSNPEIREWCNQYKADLHDIVKAGEIAGRSVESPPLAPARREPTPEEIADVWRCVDEIRERCNRVLGIPTAEDQRQCAERFLEACREKA